MVTTTAVTAPSGIINISVGAGGSTNTPGMSTIVTVPGTATKITTPGTAATRIGAPVTGLAAIVIGQPAFVSGTGKPGTATPAKATAGTPATVTVTWPPTTIPASLAVPITVVEKPVYTSVPVYAPTYSSITGGPGGSGGHGGFARTSVRLTPGDVVTVAVGATGSGSIGGISLPNYSGGNGGGAGAGSGGGGGGATVVTVNGTVVAVAAGGGGGGGGGSGNPGSYTYSTTPGTPTTSTSSSSLAEEKAFSYSASGQTWTVPVGVTTLTVDLKGAGGGGGGWDDTSGYEGSAGRSAQGAITVAAGDTITVYTGGGGLSGVSSRGGAAGGAAGGSYPGYQGGTGGNAGSSGTSGGGGGGGGATVILKNGVVVAVAGGGGGGGGGGDNSAGQPVNSESTISGTAGQDGGDKSGDGGGGGGGGGGAAGGAGGAVRSGDNGAYSGSRGSNLLPTNGSEGTDGATGGVSKGNGANGSALISWVRSVTTTITVPGTPVVSTNTVAGQGGVGGSQGSGAQVSGQGRGVQGQGGTASYGESGGGGGGGGYWGGQAGGTNSEGGSGGSGGVSYGSYIEAATATKPGGTTSGRYPNYQIGYANNGGGAIIDFVKSFNISIKQTSNWRTIDSGWVKVGGSWRELLNGWTRVNGAWKPLINNGLEIAVTPTKTYSIARSASSIDDGGSVTFTLSTTAVTTGTELPYTVTGLTAAEVAGDSDPLTGSYIVGTKDSITIHTNSWSTQKSNKVIQISLDNSTATNSCTIIDTFIPSVYGVTASAGSINEGQSVTFTLGTANAPAGEEIGWTASGISQSDLSSGTLSGTFIVGSAESASFTLVADTLTEGTEQLTVTLYGKGASASCNIIDTSRAPIAISGSLALSGSGSWTVPDYVTSATFTIAGGGGGGGGSDQGGDNDWLFGEGGSPSNKVTTTVAVTAGQVYSYDMGSGGAGAVTSKHNYPSGVAGGTSTITRSSTTIISSPGGNGGASRLLKAFSAGKGSSNGGASGGNGSSSGYGTNGSAGQNGFGTITWTGSRPG